MATTKAQAAAAANKPAAAAPASASTVNTSGTNGTEAAAASDPVKEKKPKPEKMFGGNSRVAEMKRRESEVNTNFNRIGRKIKALGISEDAQKQIMTVLKGEYQAALTEALSQPYEEEDGAEEGTADESGKPSFV
jgi:hypothetical protein